MSRQTYLREIYWTALILTECGWLQAKTHVLHFPSQTIFYFDQVTFISIALAIVPAAFLLASFYKRSFGTEKFLYIKYQANDSVQFY